MAAEGSHFAKQVEKNFFHLFCPKTSGKIFFPLVFHKNKWKKFFSTCFEKWLPSAAILKEFLKKFEKYSKS